MATLTDDEQTAIQHYLPLHDAARRVVALVQRGPLPPAARQALLELQLALATASLAKVVDAVFDESRFDESRFDEERDDEAGDPDDVRLSA